MAAKLNNVTLAQLVNQHHQAAAVFEKYHLDFCCKGKRTLAKACEEQQLDVHQISAELESLFENKDSQQVLDFEKMTLPQLCDYLVQTHHSYVKKEAPQIFAYLQKVSGKHGDRHAELHKIFELFAAVKEEMEGHMQKEERILFPRIKELHKLAEQENVPLQLSISFLQSPIRIMEQEHDHAGTLLNEIRILTKEYTPPQDACTTFRLSYAALQAFERDLHQHVHLENNILFPKALHLFRALEDSVLN